jgi:hypothetical protein
MTGWDVSPFEAEGLGTSRLRPPVLPEAPRHGEDPAQTAHRAVVATRASGWTTDDLLPEYPIRLAATDAAAVADALVAS